MADYYKIVRERQKAIRRQIDGRGIAIKAIQHDGGWESPTTVLSYFPAKKDVEPAAMSVATLYRLIDRDALPLDLLSQLLPNGVVIVRLPESVDHDEIAEGLRDYLLTKDRAHHPDSEDGREIGPGEDNILRGKFARVRAA